MKKFIAMSTFMLAVTVPGLASAEVEMGEVTQGAVHITYNASDLASQYGRDRLETLIRRAAEKVCGSSYYRVAGSLSQAAENRKCYDEAVEKALGSLTAVG
ncbi:MAG: UrcA family protein [Pseudohongiellaceae bacterium]|jgi:UrcA family protein